MRVRSEAAARGKPKAPRPERIGTVLTVLLLLLSIVVFWNLNGIALMIWDIPRAFSVAILVLCLTALGMLARYVGLALRAGGMWLVAFYLAYVALGSVVDLQSPFLALETLGEEALKHVASVLLIVTYSAFGYLLVRSGIGGTRLMRMILIICCVSSLSALIGIVYPEWGMITQQTGLLLEGRYGGFFGNPNEVGLQAAFTVAIAALVASRTRRVTYFTLGAICAGLGAFLSFSKKGILLFLVVSLVLGILMQRLRLGIRKTVVLMLAGAVVTLFIGLVRGVSGGSEISSAFTREQSKRLEDLNQLLFQGRIDDKTTTGRIELAIEALDLWKEAPLLGNGLTSLDRMPVSGLGPHNTYLLVLGETGLVGFAFFLVAFGRITFVVLRLPIGPVKVFGIGVLIVLLGGFLGSHTMLTLRNHNALMGLMCGMAAAIPISAGRRHVAQSRPGAAVYSAPYCVVGPEPGGRLI